MKVRQPPVEVPRRLDAHKVVANPAVVPPPPPGADKSEHQVPADAEAALTLVDAGQRPSATHGMTAASSWLAARTPPGDDERRTLKALSKLLVAERFDAVELSRLCRAAVDGGFEAAFAHALARRAGRVLDGVLEGARGIPDVHGALELLKETLPPAAFRAVATQVAPLVRDEVIGLGALSDEIMKLPRGVDGRATQRALDKVEGELVPRARALRALCEVAGLELHALLAQRTEAAPRVSVGVSHALASIAAQRKGDAREITVHVQTRADAEALLGTWLAREALVDTSEMSPTLVKHLLGRARTFHWDDVYGENGLITGHYPGSDHGLLPHLQIHTADGQEVRVFFPKKFARTEEGA